MNNIAAKDIPVITRDLDLDLLDPTLFDARRGGLRFTVLVPYGLRHQNRGRLGANFNLPGRHIETCECLILVAYRRGDIIHTKAANESIQIFNLPMPFVRLGR